MTTVKAVAVIGINSGYGHGNESTMNLVEFGSLCQRIADEVMAQSGVYVGMVLSPVKVEYKTDWGCPVGGEDAVRIEADCNPSYSKVSAEEYVSLWKVVFIKICKALMRELKQSTVTVSFQNVELEYLKKGGDE